MHRILYGVIILAGAASMYFMLKLILSFMCLPMFRI